MSKIVMMALVMSSAPTGYRRAGFALQNGENKLKVTKDEFESLDSDSRLSVKIITHTLTNKTKTVQQGNSLDDVGLDLTNAPGKLKPVINNIHRLQQTTPSAKKPNCDEIVFEGVGDNEEPVKVTVTAKERDEAWAWYQENVVKVTQ